MKKEILKGVEATKGGGYEAFVPKKIKVLFTILLF